MKKKVKRTKLKHAPGNKGLPPGTRSYTGDQTDVKTDIELFIFGTESCAHTHPTIDELLLIPKNNDKKWINIFGINDENIVRKICDKYGIHYLYQEDIMNVIPKTESRR